MKRKYLAPLLFFLFAGAIGQAAGLPKNNRPAGPSSSGRAPAASGDLHAQPILGRPTDRTITVSTVFIRASQYYYRYGTAPGDLGRRTDLKTAAAGSVPTEDLSGLQPGTKYYYRLEYKDTGAADFTSTKTFSFVTQRPAGTAYTFLVEADPHLDENSDQATYEAILAGMGRQEADFLVDLGDASMAQKLARTDGEIEARNVLLRSYWDNIAHSLPFFMVLGNHDGEAAWDRSIPVAVAARRKYFPNPVPNAFYTGLSDTIFAWTWGDALFVVLNPYANGEKKPREDNWNWTLGKMQYDWVSGVLRQSRANYKFVFLHHLVGGIDESCRGGAAAARLYEWGGGDPTGGSLFTAKRPGWAKTIHQLCTETGVNVVFHGHDHFYGREVLDGVVYQLVPQPSLRRQQNTAAAAAEYGYKEGVFLPSPGYLRIRVAPDGARVDYVQGIEGGTAYSYAI